MTSRLLVLSADNKSTVQVVSALHELCGDVNSDQDSSESIVTVLNLKTKYYRASVEVHRHQVLDNVPEPAFKHELHDYEALLCVVDATQPNDFRHVRTLAERIVESSSYDVSLFVAGTSSATTECVQQMQHWCEDTGFEFVSLNAKEERSCDNVMDEKQGIERVLEALHCNMWRSMERNFPHADGKTTVEAEAKESADNAVEKSTLTDDSRLQTLLQALEIAGEPDISTHKSDENHDADLDMAQLSALISEVKKVRDQGQHLSDEQRRERAAEVAMKLWNVLGEED